MRTVIIIAAKEIQEGLRNRWVLATTLLLAALALSLTFLGSAPTGNVGAGALTWLWSACSSLTDLSAAADRALDFPRRRGRRDGAGHDDPAAQLSRWPLPGRSSENSAGHVLILRLRHRDRLWRGAAEPLAITGVSVLAASWYAFASMLGTSILLGAVFVAIGYLISSLVRDRGTAAGISVGIWLLMVLVFDMGLLGILVIDQGQLSRRACSRRDRSRSDRSLPADQSDRVQRQPVLRDGRIGRHGERGCRSAVGGLAGLDRRPVGARNDVFCTEGIMTLRIVCVLMAAILLPGCNQDAANSVVPPPVALNSDAMGVFCGMNLLEHPGPKGQIITASRIDPFWFTSVRDTVAFTLMPDQPRDIRVIYVSDMARALSWDDPGATNWVDARKAFFVIESRKQGGMGAAEAVPFGNRAAADAFVTANGGKVVTFAEIPSAYVLGQRHCRRPG